jgi:hypothetical protein
MSIIVDNWADFVTALGTANATVEFSKEQIVPTTDRTINPDKIYVDSNGTPQINVKTSDLPNLYENKLVIDMNDIAPNGISQVDISCSYIYGHGATIKNLLTIGHAAFHFNLGSGYYPLYWDGLAFLNVSVNNDSDGHAGRLIKDESRYGIIYSNMVISGKANGLLTDVIFDSVYGYARNSSFTIELGDNARFRSIYGNRPNFKMYNCRLKMLGTSLDKNGSHTDIYGENCYISGKITGPLNASGTYSVYDIECASITGSGTSLIANSDKCSTLSGVISAAGSDINIQLLQNNGFDVQT